MYSCSVSWQVTVDIPLPMQLTTLYLWANELMGTIPESWSNLTSVSLLGNTILQLCTALLHRTLPTVSYLLVMEA